MLVQTPIYKYLALVGTLPFIICTLFFISPSSNIGTTAWVEMALHSYGLVIVTFMCGTHWGLYLFTHPQCSINLFIISNLITLVCWFCYLSEHGTIILLSQICAFIVLLAIDRHLQQKEIIHMDYYKTRRNITAIVVLTLSMNLI